MEKSKYIINHYFKDILFAKSAEKISDLRPQVAASVFDDPQLETEVDSEESEE